ncbi:hypothetical protein KVV02_004597 [Mortierella alpina]|uniref:EXPERA domain-containing protein n=1 Tax=Mortierella alpina TaxID=64518 RepID=A0A9P8CXF9_MORAP|nr:hypothetical protein KVV02_004597 [Mortierella alpina]
MKIVYSFDPFYRLSVMSESSSTAANQETLLTTATSHTSEHHRIIASDQYIVDLAHSLRSCVSKSGPTADAGELVEGGILTSANHKAWYPNIHPVNWVHKMFSTHHYGNYVVSDRKTSATVWEDMPVYARIGMHLLFACSLDHKFLETHRLQHLFSEESLKQGLHFDAPESVVQIPHFIKTYRLDLSELLEPDIKNYRTFNEFFYRKLRPDARIIDQDPVWRFTLHTPMLTQSRLQPTVGCRASSRYLQQRRSGSKENSTIARDPVKIGGTYFTVNPMAVNENLDVFTENMRVVTVMDLEQGGKTGSDAFDQCVFLSIGALLVGSICMTGGGVLGNSLQKGDELGYFAYGGSTCILLFKKGAVQFDEDLLRSSKKGLETLHPFANMPASRVPLSARPKDLIMFTYFAMHIPATILLDLIPLYPDFVTSRIQPLVNLNRFYIENFKDPFMATRTQIWFETFLHMEGLVQLPIFIYAAWLLYRNSKSAALWICIYTAHVITTVLPCLTSLHLNKPEQFTIELTDESKATLTLIYLPWLVVPMWMLYECFQRVRSYENVGLQKSGKKLQ